MRHWFRKKQDTEDPNAVYKVAINDPEAQWEYDYDYPDNYIRTTKYTLLTFLPLNLFNQVYSEG